MTTEQDPNIEKNRFDMETIWAKSPKETNLPPSFSGEYVRYFPTDPEYLYDMGFVDTEKYTLAEWKKAFEDCKQPSGDYLISKEKFILLGKYKYSGVVKKPLDIMQIREGWYELSDWHEFVGTSVIPSTVLTVEQFVQIQTATEKECVKKGIIVGSRILIDKNAKLKFKQLLDNFPSPIRNRELSVANAYERLLKSESTRSQNAIVKTTFKRGQKLGDTEKKELKEALLKTSKIAATSNNEEVSTLSLKDLRKKSPKGKQSV